MSMRKGKCKHKKTHWAVIGSNEYYLCEACLGELLWFNEVEVDAYGLLSPYVEESVLGRLETGEYY